MRLTVRSASTAGRLTATAVGSTDSEQRSADGAALDLAGSLPDVKEISILPTHF